MEKPSLAFFDRIAEAAQRPAREIAYVGDRLDNDIAPAREAGMTAIFIRRGPWGHIQAGRPEAALAHGCVDLLAEIAGLLAQA